MHGELTEPSQLANSQFFMEHQPPPSRGTKHKNHDVKQMDYAQNAHEEVIFPINNDEEQSNNDAEPHQWGDEDLGLDLDDDDDEEPNEDEEEPNKDEEDEEDEWHLDTTMMGKFKEYCAYAHHNFLPLSKEAMTTIELMATLKKKKAPLDTVDEIMEWHLKSSGLLREHEALANHPRYCSQKK